jgi:hypothetical protein
MTKKIGSDPRPASIAKAPKPAAKAKAARARGFGKKKPAAAKQGFPRTTWQDGAKLGKQIEKSKVATQNHARIGHAKPDYGGKPATGDRPPIAMRYGIVRPPPIAMRYGIIRPDPNQPPAPPVKPPPIAMRYGVIRPDPNGGGGSKPPIAMKYGVMRPPEKPPVAMKYGVMRPKPNSAD